MAQDIRKHISNRVRELRAKRRMTQQELAEAADLDYKSIQRLEAKSPRFHPKVDTLEKIAKAFGLTVSELLKK
jgi:transcriptional regulator with XRE-family HTH domain